MLRRVRTLVSRRGVIGATSYFVARAVAACLQPTARQSWSQFGEDLVARDILGLEPGYYVDVGCNEPIRWSNTFLFYLHGWNGLLVDGNRDLIEACRRERPADCAVCCLLGEADGEGEIAIYDEHALSSAVATHNERRRGEARLLETRKVPIRTLTSLLEEHRAPNDIAFLSIDVEGMDLMVLRGLDFGRFRPRLIAVEDATFDPLDPRQSAIAGLLTGHGYRLHSHVHPTLFFVDGHVMSKAFHGPTSGVRDTSDV
jgi:FkbM family methyltransferase